jgi:hypothetical protein
MPFLQRKRSNEEKTEDFLRRRARDVARLSANESQIEAGTPDHLPFEETQTTRNRQLIPSRRKEIDLTEVD